MKILSVLFVTFQVLVGVHLFFPLLLYVKNLFKKESKVNSTKTAENDYAIIVTAYEQITLLPSVVESILKLNYSNYLIYIVADKCDITNLKFDNDRVVLLRPEETLASNTKSHFYAIHRFRRSHNYLTIIDSDNLVDANYLTELDYFFEQGYLGVQGVRKAKNLNTPYACLDEAGDIYYRFIDRKLLFDSGSSASLAGSGMAFNTTFYRECLEHLIIEGAGFDKVLQMEILNRAQRIAFAEKAVVYDEKTSKSDQLVKQRARWINTWFKYAGKGLKLMFTGLAKLNWNQFLCGLIFSRPPLFIIGSLTILSVALDVFLMPNMLFFWLGSILSFFIIFFVALNYFKAAKVIYNSLFNIPVFMFLQIISLFKAKKANKISTATVHYFDSNINDINKTN